MSSRASVETKGMERREADCVHLTPQNFGSWAACAQPQKVPKGQEGTGPHAGPHLRVLVHTPSFRRADTAGQGSTPVGVGVGVERDA